MAESTRVQLNVGGRLFATSRETLAREPSFLSKLVAQDAPWQHPPNNEPYFIDRDGELFRHVLSFLRDGDLSYVRGTSLQSQLLREADFFGLDSMKCALMEPHVSTEEYVFVDSARNNDISLYGTAELQEYDELQRLETTNFTTTEGKAKWQISARPYGDKETFILLTIFNALACRGWKLVSQHSLPPGNLVRYIFSRTCDCKDLHTLPPGLSSPSDLREGLSENNRQVCAHTSAESLRHQYSESKGA